jgi:transposase-like protein
MGILGDIREVLKTLKHGKPSKIYCPRCASPNIHLSSSFDYWITPKKYVCDDCGYSGLIVMELEKEENQGEPSS